MDSEHEDDDETLGPGPKEQAYDEHFSPLVARLIALSKEHGITLFVHCELDGGDYDCNSVTTSIPQPEDAQLCRTLIRVVRPPTVMAITVFGGGDHGE